ncbi:MAG: coproporphyrinogen dehydrogenase HemZ [Lachnospiraceae bacterium]|nr:coproporphyrinogen dehydrogenase HemZ [Lachnospiraceae bacterium]MEE3460398.1 coproporphyrinogen dehydrogenase HemZ [Lachnospiraceae bacterium]
MLKVILSEMDFDFDIRALLTAVFPGQKVYFSITGEYGVNDIPDIIFNVGFDRNSIIAEALLNDRTYTESGNCEISGSWKKNPGRTSNPSRTRYKNLLKRLIFDLCFDIDEHDIASKHIIRRRPLWGTLTGVRPVKAAQMAIEHAEKSSENTDPIRYAAEVKAQAAGYLEKEYYVSEEKALTCVNISLRQERILKALADKVSFGEEYINDVRACTDPAYKTKEHILGNDDYSLYIGIPFCPTTCMYCSFASYQADVYKDYEKPYLDSLISEIDYTGELLGCKPLTIYVGGGTPTALSVHGFERLMKHISQRFDLEKVQEFTVEAGRPDSITDEKLSILRSYGAGRISVNPQTMNDKTLELIGRRHTAADTVRAFKAARNAGFDNINMDLITGLPGESLNDFKRTLKICMDLGADDITVHSLVIKRAGAMRMILDGAYEERGKDIVAGELERGKVMQDEMAYAVKTLTDNGLAPYYMYRQRNAEPYFGSQGQENMGFASAGKASYYNIFIMEELQSIAACGAGAMSKRLDRNTGVLSRTGNVKSLKEYIDRVDEMKENKGKLFS